MQLQQTPVHNFPALSFQREAVIRSLVCLTAASVRFTILPTNPTDRRLELVVLITFFAGIAMAYSEAVRWRKARMEGYEPPPSRKMIKARRARLESSR